MKHRILEDWTTYPMWVDSTSKKVFIDFHNIKVEIGEATQAESDDEPHTWMFSRSENHLGQEAPEGRWTLDELIDDLEDHIDVEINKNMGAWFQAP